MTKDSSAPSPPLAFALYPAIVLAFIAFGVAELVVVFPKSAVGTLRHGGRLRCTPPTDPLHVGPAICQRLEPDVLLGDHGPDFEQIASGAS